MHEIGDELILKIFLFKHDGERHDSCMEEKR